MRVSTLYAPTLREAPADAEVISHRLMARAGMIRRVAPGLYGHLPLALRILDKLGGVIRNEMAGVHGQEVSLPILQAADLLKETGQWRAWGDELFRIRDRADRDYGLAITADEQFIMMMKGDLRSYRQLPLRLFQIQSSYCDDAKARLGMLRSRETTLFQAYSVELDEPSLNDGYRRMMEVVESVLAKAGADALVVEADAGGVPGGEAREYMIVTESGEAELCACPSCNYRASVEKAELGVLTPEAEPEKELKLVCTPDCKTMEEVAQFLGFEPEHAIKALAFTSDLGPVVALVRGDHEVNEAKVMNAVGCRYLNMADDEVLARIGSSGGYIGPIGIRNTTVVADHTVMNMVNTECGGNIKDHHYVNVNPRRDFKPQVIADIRRIRSGDPCPACGAAVQVTRAVRVARVAKLGTVMTGKLGLTFVGVDGAEQTPFLVRAGLDLGRLIAAIAEKSWDENGLIWPGGIAPYEVAIVPVNIKDDAIREQGEAMLRELVSAGIDAILDDREERAGVKFTDADLIGYPLRITIGAKALAQNAVECKIRRTGEVILLPLANYLEKLKELL